MADTLVGLRHSATSARQPREAYRHQASEAAAGGRRCRTTPQWPGRYHTRDVVTATRTVGRAGATANIRRTFARGVFEAGWSGRSEIGAGPPPRLRGYGGQPSQTARSGGLPAGAASEASAWRRLVRKRGLEPPLPCGNKLLRLARLPVPPLPHGRGDYCPAGLPSITCTRPPGAPPGQCPFPPFSATFRLIPPESAPWPAPGRRPRP